MMPMQPNPRKTKQVRRLGTVDIAALKKRVLAIPEAEWDQENADKPNRFEALDKTRHVVFRFVSSLRDWRDSYDRPKWAEWRDVVEPVMQQAVGDYGYADGAYPRIMLARMKAGGVIQPHRDANPAAKWPHKIHVPLLTNSQVTFFVENEGFHMTEGEAVEVNNMATHAVTNAGDTDRIHLIFEYYDRAQPPPGWLMEPVR